MFSTLNGSVLDHDGKEFPTALILYSSSVVDILYGRIAKEPLIIQFDGAGDRNPLEEGRYLLFLRSEGRLFAPMETNFKIKDERVHWFTKRFIRGGYGPEMGEVPLSKVILELKALIEKYKKS